MSDMQHALPPSVDVMARTLYGEARGCGVAGMSHVANVIMNRVDHPRWWGHDPISVCQAPWQFSCWLKSDPNYEQIQKVTEDDPWFAIAVSLADRAISRKLPDVTGGADSYYALSMAKPPAWAARATKTFSDGWHVFCRVELPLPGTDTPAANNASVASQVAQYAPSTSDLNDAEYQRIQEPSA